MIAAQQAGKPKETDPAVIMMVVVVGSGGRVSHSRIVRSRIGRRILGQGRGRSGQCEGHQEHMNKTHEIYPD
jgi:hypothetical protein